MGLALQKRSFKKVFLFTALLLGFAFQGVYGQKTLSPGDIAIVTVNADDNDEGNKTFDFIPLIDLEAGTEIKFTDAAYIDANSELDSNEGTIIYTAPNAISAGTVLTYTGFDENGFVSSGSFNPAASGDNIIVFQGERSTPTFLYGVGWARGNTVWNYDSDSSPNTRSDVPPNLDEEDATILSLGTTDNYQFDADNGLQGTANTLLSLIGDESNWNEDDENAFSVFATDFTVVDPPTVAFTSSAISGEEGNTTNLSVELSEADNVDINVDVVFLPGSSTADLTDIDNYTTETLEFSGASTDDFQNVEITLTGSDGFEGTEKAVFQLQGITKGTTIEPSELTLSVTDDDAPDVVINEILYDLAGDANSDGVEDGTDDEFVEFVNNSGSDLDISDWELSDGAGVKYTFPSGTVIPADHAFVVFAAPAVGTNFGGAYLFSAGSLGLNNGGDDVILADADGNEVTSVSYSGSASESITRNPDITGDFEGHTTADAGDDESVFSPSTQVDGTPFGSKHAIGIRGAEGWRMISSPVQSATFEDFFGEFWMQGPTGSNDDSQNADGTIFYWDESGGTFTAPADMSDNLKSGKGYIVYFFEDDDNNAPGIQGGFPKIINSDGTENDQVDNISVTANDESGDGTIDEDEGWNLLGNPFDTDIIASEVIAALENVDQSATVDGNIYVWSHDQGGGNGGWVTLSGDETIAPFQGFFVRYETDGVNGNVSFSKNDLEANKGAEFFKNSIEDVITFDLRLHGEQYYDMYSLEFSENGTTELDRYDAYKLFSLNTNSINLFSTQSNNRLQKSALPIDLESRLEIPLSFDANGRSSLTFRWDEGMEKIPNEWDLILIDNEQNREIDLRRNNEYSFTVTADQQEESQISSDKKGLLNKLKVTKDPRFTLSVQPNLQGGITSDLPESVKLKPNYPNPFNPSTTIPYELTEDSDVLLTVWNMIGQKVATLVDGAVEAGTHEVNWNASDMPSGMYIARFEVKGTVFTRKMTLIK